MFPLAIRAGLPIISVRTEDVVYARMVVQFYAGEELTDWSGGLSPLKGMIGTHGRPYICFGTPDNLSRLVYNKLNEHDASLIIVNPTDPIPSAFDAGELPIPADLVAEILSDSVDITPEFMRAITGLTIKNIVELVRLTVTEYGEITPQTILQMRTRMTGALQGISPVNSDPGHYHANPELVKWLLVNASFFNTETEPQFIPRGVLLDGPAGVGKTQGAKHIAQTLQVPLYRLDLSESLGKYVGESESNLRRALSAIDHEAPCVLLIDEVEKLFYKSDDSGVTSRLLAQLLWWLQEHTSIVLTVMTTNKIGDLPPELFRPGRIDITIKMKPMTKGAAELFTQTLVKHYGYPAIKVALPDKKSFTGAEVTQLVKDALKMKLLEGK